MSKELNVTKMYWNCWHDWHDASTSTV